MCVIMATNVLELATTLKYLRAKWLSEKKLILCPGYANVMVIHATLCFFNLECSPTDLVETESKERTVNEDQMTLLNSKLVYLKRALYQQFLRSANKSNTPMFTTGKLFCGFGDNQVKQIMQHCSYMFSVSDVYKYVDIWHPTVATEVLFSISTIFEDVNISHLAMEEPEDSQEFYVDFFDAICDFDVEDSLMASIPLQGFHL